MSAKNSKNSVDFKTLHQELETNGLTPKKSSTLPRLWISTGVQSKLLKP
jgi:hypothetical protein